MARTMELMKRPDVKAKLLTDETLSKYVLQKLSPESPNYREIARLLESIISDESAATSDIAKEEKEEEPPAPTTTTAPPLTTGSAELMKRLSSQAQRVEAEVMERLKKAGIPRSRIGWQRPGEQGNPHQIPPAAVHMKVITNGNSLNELNAADAEAVRKQMDKLLGPGANVGRQVADLILQALGGDDEHTVEDRKQRRLERTYNFNLNDANAIADEDTADDGFKNDFFDDDGDGTVYEEILISDDGD